MSPEADDGSAWLSVISVTNLTVRPKGLPGVLVERYHFYAQVQDGAVRDADSGHEPWTLYPVTAGVEANTSLAANGFADPDAEPVYYYSSGLDVIASRGKRVA